MRSHAKASSVGTAMRPSTRPPRRRRSLAALLAAATFVLAFALSGPAALAGTASGRQFLFSFDGSGITDGGFSQAESIDVDQATGAVYVTGTFNGKPGLAKFHPDGTAWNFAATGTPVLYGPAADPFGNSFLKVAIDNSSGANQGRIVVDQRFPGRIYAFDAAGNSLWDQSVPYISNAVDVALDNASHPWVVAASGKAYEFDNTGSPPELIAEKTASASGTLFNIDFDASGNGYLVRNSTLRRYPGGDFTAASTAIDPTAEALTVDRSSLTGHIFTVGSNAEEYDSTGALISDFGQGYFQSPSRWSVAYDASLDRVYISQLGATFGSGGVVAAFGPPKPSGTVPDATVEAATGIAVSHATLHGKVNPQSVPNSYRFEWKQGSGSSWTTAESSPPVSLPEDSSEHAVEYQATGLAGNKSYEFRIVTANTEKEVDGFSAAGSFTTLTAASAPVVTIDSADATGTSSAHVTATIDPKQDQTTWQLEKSTDPSCASGFSNLATHTIPSEEPGTVSVEEDLEGLLPSERYCVRIKATNSAGTTTTTSSELTTDAVIPTSVDTAFAAPRTDTTARLNGYVNPEGAPVTYGFEYSEDGGASWIALPGQEYAGEDRVQAMVEQELTGLQPDTAYEFRFHAETEAGAAPQGPAVSFRTRTSAEVVAPGRGVELVSAADKGGNQNAVAIDNAFTYPLSEDGSTALWEVPGGAPGGHSSSWNAFIARRTPSGWQSSAVAPPAPEQFGGGDLAYSVYASSPDLSHFVVWAARRIPFFGTEASGALVAMDQFQHQSVLTELTESENGGIFSADRRQVLVLMGDSDQLEDISNGQREVVSIMPDGLESECGPSVPGVPQRGYGQMDKDATLVYFSAKPNGECGSATPEGIYLRRRASEETVAVDLGVSGKPSPEVIRSTPDAKSLYFTTYSALDPADENETADVYRWDEESEEASCLTCVVAEAAADMTGNSGVLVSDDFSKVYFASTKTLVPNRGMEGKTNVYVLSEGAIGYVGTFSTDFGSSQRSVLSHDGNVLTILGGPLPMTTSDRVAKCGGSVCEQQYVYEAAAGTLECISCRADGATEHRASTEGFTENDLPLAGDGSTAAFVTREALVPEDVNHDRDVYEWRNGVTRLVTDGLTERGDFNAEPHVDAVSAHGGDILFSMAQPGLTGFEQDGLAAVYDARVGGGFTPPPAVQHCDEEACQGPLAAAPQATQPGSASLAGKGNVPQPKKARCAKKRGAKHRCRHRRKRRAHRHRAHRHGAKARHHSRGGRGK